MGAEEKSLKVYDTKRTFFAKLGTTITKIFSPTQTGINNLLVGMKRSAVIKNYKNIKNASDEKAEVFEKKFEESYTLYLESIDQLILESIYKKVRMNNASDVQRDALSKYYEVIHIKENDEIEYKYRKQQYLLDLDMELLKETNKSKVYEGLKEVYLYKMEQLYKALLKHYSIKMTEKLSLTDKDQAYDKIFDTLDEYVMKIIPLKKIEDEELIKECSLYETYEVGKLDQVDCLDKKMILLGISRKLFVHSLPLIVAEKCYIKLLKDTRSLIVDTTISRKRENAYQLLLRLMEQFNDRLLSVKIYWDNNEDKKIYAQINERRKQIEAMTATQGQHKTDIQKQILYIRSDIKMLERHGDKYYRILRFYRDRLVKLGDMKRMNNSCRTLQGKFIVIKGYRKAQEQHETAC